MDLRLKGGGIGTDALLIIADTTGHMPAWFAAQSRRGLDRYHYICVLSCSPL